MSFQMTEEQQLATEALRKFLDDVIEPQLFEHGENFIPKEKMLGWLKQLTGFGLINAPFPVELGGMGSDWQTHIRLFEEVAFSSIELAGPIVLNTATCGMLLANASKAIIDKYVPGLLSGELLASVGISESTGGSDVLGIQCQAVRDGDDWVINGEKRWVTNGEYSDFLICTCKTGEGELTHILVDREEHGYEAHNIPKIALNGQSTAQVYLRDVRVPLSNTIGEIGDGLRNTMVIFERGRCHMSVWGYGLARRAMHEAVKYAKEHILHGKPIAGHQMIADKLAVMATEIDAARLLTLRAAEKIDKGERCDKECAMAKWYGTELAVRASRDAVQIHGANGISKEFIVERLLREAVMSTFPDGTTEIQKLVIARALTGVQAIR